MTTTWITITVEPQQKGPEKHELTLAPASCLKSVLLFNQGDALLTTPQVSGDFGRCSIVVVSLIFVCLVNVATLFKYSYVIVVA
jgi:hypothetical protein